MKEERLRQAFISGYVAAKIKLEPKRPLKEIIADAIAAQKRWAVLKLEEAAK